MSEFISSNIWIILMLAWPVVLGLVMLALKRPSKDKIVDWLGGVVVFLIVSVAVVLIIAVIFGVLIYLPGLLFGPIGQAVGIALMIGLFFYMAEYDDSDSHEKALKFALACMGFTVPFLFLLFKVG